jgi:hypothetical protein
MSHFGKHSKSIETLIDVTEAMLHVMEDKGIDPEKVSKSTEFSVLIKYPKRTNRHYQGEIRRIWI